MQEPTLHGWRLATQGHAHVGLFGEGAVDGLDGGRQVARDSGSEQLILWPFATRTARWASSRVWWRLREARVAVACHPRRTSSRSGSRTGLWMLCRIEDGANPGEEAGCRAGLGARLECEWLKACVRHRGREAGIVDLA